MTSKPIVLVGFMASGKSSVGARLAKNLGIPFADTDREIEKEVRKPVHRFFLETDEPLFREMESGVLSHLLSLYDNTLLVVATGGGILERKKNRDLIFGKSLCIHLKTSFETIARRIRERNTSHRLLWNNGFDRALYEKRQRHYALAHAEVATDGKRVSAVSAKIAEEVIPCFFPALRF